MRRRLVWLLAIVGLVWLYLRRGGRRPEPVTSIPPADPADDLRRKLDETKPAEPAASQPLDFPLEPPAPVVSEEVDARRRSVHEHARTAADEMRDAGADRGSDPDAEQA